ncbi:MAG: hypothetical protein PHF97_12760, partial [Bacteroidales bacterium]|nr:hypothetical protein [Bacteroidales bacterium]
MKKHVPFLHFSFYSLLSFLFISISLHTIPAVGQTNDTVKSVLKSVIPHIEIPGPTDQGTTTCPNSNFGNGTFDNWNGCYGRFTDPCLRPGFLTEPIPPLSNVPLHKIINSSWLDPNTTANGGGLPTIPPGETHSARIGDTTQTGETDKASELKYAITIGQDNYFFIYRYAIVLQSGGHPKGSQPDFEVKITDENNVELDPVCGTYYFEAPTTAPSPLPDGWHLIGTGGNGSIYWKEWSTIGMDLTPYTLPPYNLQTIYINFKVRGCTYNTHFGCAYISTTCSQMNITLSGCEGSGQVTLTGPPGFTIYEWQGPFCPTCPPDPPKYYGQTVTITAAQGASTGNRFDLNLTAANGCVVKHVQQTISFTSVIPGFTSVVNCVGNPSSFTDISTTTNPSQPIVNRRWKFEATDPFGDLTTNPTITHTFTLGPHEVTVESHSLDGCVGTFTQTINVGPPPTITNLTTGKEICSEENANISMDFSQTGASATWTSVVTTGTATITNNPTNQSGTLINDQIVNTGTIDAVATYTITPKIGDCSGVPITYLVTVHPTATIAPIIDQTFCNGTVVPATPVTSPVGGTTFAWTNSDPSIGLPASGIGDISGFTATNNGIAPVIATIEIVPTANNCEGTHLTYTITVNPTATVVPITNQTFCNGTVVPATSVTSPVGGTTFAWTNSDPSIGLPASGTGDIASFTASNTGTVPVTATIEITPTANSCEGTHLTYTITINPTPTVNSVGNQVLCHNATTSAVAFSGDAPGTVFNWTNSDPTIGLAASGTGDIAAFTATNTGTIPVTATIVVTPTFTNTAVTCTGTSTSFTITVNPI